MLYCSGTMLNLAKSYLEGHFDFHQSCKDAKAYQVKEIMTISHNLSKQGGGEGKWAKGVGGGVFAASSKR